MLAPTSFVLPEPVKNISVPPPCPPSFLKHQVYDDPYVFEKVDGHAIRVSQNTYPTFKDLLWDLAFRYQLSDLEKARVIFRWMTACDMNSLQFVAVPPNGPEEVLLSLKNLKGSYANAFELMCSYAGLCCLTISGFAKGVDYKPGDVFKKDEFNHTWNVIHLQNSWQLIDAHWATRYLTSGKNTQDSIVYQYDDFYFIMEPQQAVYSHFPEKTEWQLLEKPLTLNQFENLPLTKSQFFKCGMDFRSQHHGVVHSKDGYLKMNLGFWKPDSFTYKLQTDGNKDQFEGVPLRYYVLQETVNNQINFFFRFPTAGVFYLTIFAQELNEHNQPISQENTFRAACEYKIIADKAAANHTPYPMTCHDANWGPSWSLITHYQLTPQQEDGVISITSPNNKPFVKTEIVFDKLREDVSLLCKLRKNGVEDEDILDQYIEISEKPDKTSFSINLPEPGEYGLEIYANEPSEGDTYTHICQYLLDFEPPPGYKPQASVFGPIKPGSKPLSHKPSKIRDMYNYEKDATPLGSLPKPYMPSQYAPEDITMIPGQVKSKPMPFAYQQNKNAATKADDSDLEMPDFLPPPPPLLTNQTISVEYESSVSVAPPPPPPNNMSNKPFVDDKINQFDPKNQRSFESDKKLYQPGNQQMNTGDKFIAGQKNLNYSIQGATPFSKSVFNSRKCIIKRGSLSFKNFSGPNNATSGPLDESIFPQKSNSNERLAGYKGESLDNDSVKLQPYLANVEKGQSPQLSRKVYGHNIPASGKDQLGSEYSTSGSKYLPTANVDKTPVSARYSASVDKTERQNLSELNMVSSAFGKSDSITVQQPYLQNILTGGSPGLSRRVMQKPGESNQGIGYNMSSSSDPKTAADRFPRESDSLNNESKTTAAFRGYGRPNFKSGVATEGSQGMVLGQSQFQQPPNQEDNLISSGTNIKDNSAASQQYSKDHSFASGSPNIQHQTPSSISAKGTKPGPYNSQYQTPSNFSTGSAMQGSGPNQYTFAKGIGPDSQFQAGKGYGQDPQFQAGKGYGQDPQFQAGKGYGQDPQFQAGKGYGQDPQFQTGKGYGQDNQFQGGLDSKNKQYPNVSISSVNTSQDPRILSKQSNFKDQESKFSNSSYQPNTYTVNTSKEFGENRNDPKKISNIAVTLSPSGFKNPYKLDLSDQYNNQYEDSSKIVPSPFQKYRPDESTANWASGPMQKEPPKNFEPKPIELEEEIYKPEFQALPSEMPIKVAISPEETSKIFQKVDEHAMQVSAQQQDNFNQLIWQLIYARNITDELEKVRVIFLWLCTKDLHKMNFDNIKQDSPEEILMGIRTGKSTYAQIFLTLCRYAGLHCKLIVGYAKGADYVPGMKFQGRQGEHSWNAVLIEGVWRLIDCHWAARRLIGKEHKPENVRYELDMFYFLANPSQLIYTHFPHDKDWQLLHHSINIEEFESLAPVKSMFFKYNLDLVTHKNAVIQSNAPEFELRIAFPKGIEERLLFTFTLSFNDGSEKYNEVSLLRYGRQELDFINNHSCFWIRTPIPGSYKLLIYAKLINVEPNVQESDSQKMFGAICEYKIDSNFPLKQALPPFPPCQSSTYGPNEMYKQYPIESQNVQSSFYIENGTVEIKFLIRKPDIRVMAKLFSCNVKNSDQLTEQCILQRLVGKDEAIINVFLPDAGEYGLEVYANDSKKNGNSFYAVWQYFIVSTTASIVSGLPSLQPGYLGPYEPKFSDYGLSTYSHKDPFIVANTGDLCIQLKTTRDKPVRIMAQLIHCSHNVSEMCSDQFLQLGRDSVVYFLIRLPHQGFFKFQIFALPYSEMGESLPGVFNYLIEGNQPSQYKVGFPQQFGQWKEGCYLYEPTNGVLGLDGKPDKITFRMDVIRAKSLAVVDNDNNWTHLEKNSDGIWTGDVDMKNIWKNPSTNELSICGNFGIEADANYATILKYAIQK